MKTGNQFFSSGDLWEQSLLKKRKVKIDSALSSGFPADGKVEVYIIPDEKKGEVLKKIYPFIPVPSLEDVMTDIHEDKKFKVKEFCVTREGKMNMLVSPYYFKSGGTVIDW